MPDEADFRVSAGYCFVWADFSAHGGHDPAQALTIKEMRLRLGVSANAQVIAEETDDGILLRAGVTFPVEIYSDRRVAEFRRHNEDALAGFRLKKK